MKNLLFLLSILFTSIHADSFKKGSIGVNIAAGSASLNTNEDTKNYTVIGAGADYFFADDISLGLEYTYWSGNTPNISQLTVPLNYYIPFSKKVLPYLGTFYRYTSMGEPYSDYSSYGVKAGITVNISKNTFLGAGWIEEYYKECSNFKECSTGYPELLILFTF
ncbi:outer membrane beta-barrel protein [Sulfurimonas sp. HSL-1716]|uniref:outer membrane beta-barrel protein n=1 Tax=Hydrocurvibacter sulfurireducens TaxID=3131937 RepID=UPI0031F81BF8